MKSIRELLFGSDDNKTRLINRDKVIKELSKLPETEIHRLVMDNIQIQKGITIWDFDNREPGCVQDLVAALSFILKTDEFFTQPLTKNFILTLYKKCSQSFFNAQERVNIDECKRMPQGLRKTYTAFPLINRHSYSANGLLKLLGKIFESGQETGICVVLIPKQHIYNCMCKYTSQIELSKEFQKLSESEEAITYKTVGKTIDERRKQVETLLYFASKQREIYYVAPKPELVDDLLNKLIAELNHESATNTFTKKQLFGIIQKFVQLHPFVDRNTRTFVICLLFGLLIKIFGEVPPMLENPNKFDCYSLEELEEEVKAGMEMTKRLIKGEEIKVETISWSYSLFQNQMIEDQKKGGGRYFSIFYPLIEALKKNNDGNTLIYRYYLTLSHTKDSLLTEEQFIDLWKFLQDFKAKISGKNRFQIPKIINDMEFFIQCAVKDLRLYEVPSRFLKENINDLGKKLIMRYANLLTDNIKKLLDKLINKPLTIQDLCESLLQNIIDRRNERQTFVPSVFKDRVLTVIKTIEDFEYFCEKLEFLLMPNMKTEFKAIFSCEVFLDHWLRIHLNSRQKIEYNENQYWSDAQYRFAIKKIRYYRRAKDIDGILNKQIDGKSKLQKFWQYWDEFSPTCFDDVGEDMIDRVLDKETLLKIIGFLSSVQRENTENLLTKFLNIFEFQYCNDAVRNYIYSDIFPMIFNLPVMDEIKVQFLFASLEQVVKGSAHLKDFSIKEGSIEYKNFHQSYRYVSNLYRRYPTKKIYVKYCNACLKHHKKIKSNDANCSRNSLMEKDHPGFLAKLGVK